MHYKRSPIGLSYNSIVKVQARLVQQVDGLNVASSQQGRGWRLCPLLLIVHPPPPSCPRRSEHAFLLIVLLSTTEPTFLHAQHGCRARAPAQQAWNGNKYQQEASRCLPLANGTKENDRWGLAALVKLQGKKRRKTKNYRRGHIS